MNRKPIVIGIVGGPATGKGEIAGLLQENGFISYSLSDALRARATILGLSHDRQVLTDIANNLRAEFGAGALAREARKMLEGSGYRKIVIESNQASRRSEGFTEGNGSLCYWRDHASSKEICAYAKKG